MHPTPLPQTQRGSAAFSLIELLVVVAMIAIMTSLTLPAIRSVGQSNALTNAGNLVTDLAGLARQEAITQNTLTALVLATKVEDPSLDQRLFCLMELSPGGTAWNQISPWNTLPEGIVVDASQSAGFLHSPPVVPVLKAPNHRGREISSFAYQVFGPNGAMRGAAVPGNPPLVLRLVSGHLENGQLQQTDSANYYEIILNAFTGMPKVERP